MDATVARGRILWDSIYEPHAVKLHEKLSSYHPDFMGEYTCTPMSPRFSSPTAFIFRPFHSLSLVYSDRLNQQPLHAPLLHRRPVSHLAPLAEPMGREGTCLCFARA